MNLEKENRMIGGKDIGGEWEKIKKEKRLVHVSKAAVVPVIYSQEQNRKKKNLRDDEIQQPYPCPFRRFVVGFEVFVDFQFDVTVKIIGGKCVFCRFN